MKTALLTISPTGEITQVRPSGGKGFDLTRVPAHKAGRVEVRRSSLIEYDGERRGWNVRFIDASKTCVECPDGFLGLRDIRKAGRDTFDGMLPVPETGGRLHWQEYELAAKAEVFMLEHWRKSGLLKG